MLNAIVRIVSQLVTTVMSWFAFRAGVKHEKQKRQDERLNQLNDALGVDDDALARKLRERAKRKDNNKRGG